MALYQHNHSSLCKHLITSLSLTAALLSANVFANEPPSLQPQMVFSSYFNKQEIKYVYTYWPLKYSDYTKGLTRLKEYYVNRLKDAPEKDKYYLQSEFDSLVAEMADTKKSYDSFYSLIQERVKQFKKVESLFPDSIGMKIRHAIQDADNQYKVVRLINETKRSKKLSDKASAEAEYQLGNVAADNLDFKRALQHYQNAVKLNRNNRNYLLALASLLTKLGEDAVAKQFMKQANNLSNPLIIK